LRRGSTSRLTTPYWSTCVAKRRRVSVTRRARSPTGGALQLDSEDIGSLYSSAFLLEQEGRLAEASKAWRSSIEWNESRGHTLQSVWPKQELERLGSA